MPITGGHDVGVVRQLLSGLTDRQGRSGLGLEAQQAAVRAYLGSSAPIAEFTAVETGKRNDRPELERALALCRRRKARRVIAKLDRLSRNLAFIAALMDSGVDSSRWIIRMLPA